MRLTSYTQEIINTKPIINTKTKNKCWEEREVQKGEGCPETQQVVCGEYKSREDIFLYHLLTCLFMSTETREVLKIITLKFLK